MFNSHRLIAQTVGRTWGAVISKTSKTAPKPSPNLYRAFKQMETIISAFEEKWEKEM